MKLKIVAVTCLLLACVVVVVVMPPSSSSAVVAAQSNDNKMAPRPAPRPMLPKPDLIVKEYQFAPTNDKGLRVNVANIGNAGAGACVLRLTIRKIKGVSVGRTMEMNVPAIPAAGNDWITFIADGILPKDVDIKDTTFKLNVDVKNTVKESKENNNEKWHNL